MRRAHRVDRDDRGARRLRVVVAVLRRPGRCRTRRRARHQRERHGAAFRALPSARLHARAALARPSRARPPGTRPARAAAVPRRGGPTGLDRDELVQHAERWPAGAQRRGRECDARVGGRLVDRHVAPLPGGLLGHRTGGAGVCRRAARPRGRGDRRRRRGGIRVGRSGDGVRGRFNLRVVRCGRDAGLQLRGGAGVGRAVPADARAVPGRDVRGAAQLAPGGRLR